MRKAAVLFDKKKTIKPLSEIKKGDLFISWEEAYDDGKKFIPGYSITDKNGCNLFLAKENPYYDKLGELIIDIEPMEIC